MVRKTRREIRQYICRFYPNIKQDYQGVKASSVQHAEKKANKKFPKKLKGKWQCES